jgi:hypothetical protein
MAEAPDKAERRTLEQGTVGEHLAGVSRNLLPQQIQQDANVQWVLSYKDSDSQYEAGSDPTQIAYYAAGRMVSNLLQERLPFYTATLFHIGRQWKISESLGKEALRLQDEKNLLASEQNVIVFAKKAGRDLDPSLIRENVIAISNAAADQHGRSLEQAQGWWTIWAKEVADLRMVVLAFRDHAPRPADDEQQQQLGWLSTFSSFLFVQQRPSRTRYALRDGGVIFRDDVDPWPMTTAAVTALLPLIFSFAASVSGFHSDEFHYLVREIQIQPAIREAEVRLRGLYGNHNPFDEFAVGKAAASERLVQLIEENRFEGYRLSEWRRAWEATLGPDMEFARPKAEEALAPERVEYAVRSADSAIKKALADLNTRRSPIETFSEYLQRIFEKKWLTSVGYSVFRKDVSPNDVWSVTNLESLLLKVVQGLNTIGYTLAIPETGRLETLAKKTNQSIEWWNLSW